MITERLKLHIPLLIFCILLFLPLKVHSGEKQENQQLTLTGPVTKLVCTNCHGWRAPITEPRLLNAPHENIRLTHGKGLFWCYTCHNQENIGTLHGNNKTPVEFATPQLICRTCHFSQVRDWQGGAHGKRSGSWQGQPTAWRCTACHNPHQPKTAPFTASPPPKRPNGAVPIKHNHPPLNQQESDRG
ncbi:MAG: hypothetical protein HQL68_09165 [Magnetococcales bacterium]|nr:hypothetical protein [Magnetococcales bacterium]